MPDAVFRGLRAFRWVLPVFYAGLGVGLVVFAVAYMVKVGSFALNALSNDPLWNALGLLGLIDGALIAGLTVMVMTSGYAIFVGKPHGEDDGSGPATVGFAALKTKFAATLTAIGAVNLLEYALDPSHIELMTLMALGAVEFVFLAITLAFAWIEIKGAAHSH